MGSWLLGESEVAFRVEAGAAVAGIFMCFCQLAHRTPQLPCEEGRTSTCISICQTGKPRPFEASKGCVPFPWHHCAQRARRLGCWRDQPGEKLRGKGRVQRKLWRGRAGPKPGQIQGLREGRLALGNQKEAPDPGKAGSPGRTPPPVHLPPVLQPSRI